MNPFNAFDVSMNNLVAWTEYAKIMSEPVSHDWQWSSPNKYLIDNEAFVLIRFFPDKPAKGPGILIGAPQAGHSPECIDMDEYRSLVRTLHNLTGRPVYGFGWKDATYERKDCEFDETVEAIWDSVDAIKKDGCDSVCGAGVCQRGYTFVMAEALRPGTFAGLLLIASPMDFAAAREKSEIQKALKDRGYGFFERQVVNNGGLLDGRFILNGFINMNLSKIWHDATTGLYFNILSGDKKAVKRYRGFKRWYFKTQHLPGKLYLRIVKDLFIDNLLHGKALAVKGEIVDPGKIKCPVAVAYGDKDEITFPEEALGILSVISSAKKAAFEVKKAGHFFFASEKHLKTAFIGPIKFLGLFKEQEQKELLAA
ncbi:MAG: DUF3141 domain-containing protein [Candidatus Falkowbacteria bacterium]